MAAGIHHYRNASAVSAHRDTTQAVAVGVVGCILLFLPLAPWWLALLFPNSLLVMMQAWDFVTLGLLAKVLFQDPNLMSFLLELRGTKLTSLYSTPLKGRW